MKFFCHNNSLYVLKKKRLTLRILKSHDKHDHHVFLSHYRQLSKPSSKLNFLSSTYFSQMENVILYLVPLFLIFNITYFLLPTLSVSCNGLCKTFNDCDGQLSCINGKCNNDTAVSTHICSRLWRWRWRWKRLLTT